MMENWYELIRIQPFEDTRGSLKKLLMISQLKQNKKIEEIYVLFSNQGSVRGNHYHKETLEYFSVISGEAKVALKNLHTGAFEEIVMSANNNVILKVPPYVVHAFKNEGEEPFIMVAISSKEYNKDDTDTFPMIII
ncbi:WxcM-like domain-containing protein [Neobacillus niacini]|uniref:polysaccharide biosynthesis C-terminal domain-containing protein n=1 Tax=Neobacillus niacini TaxID=86668 RepID=UPI003B02A5C7